MGFITWKQNMQDFLSSRNYLHESDIKSRYSEVHTIQTPTLEMVIIVSSGNISHNNHTLATLTKHYFVIFL